MEIYSNYYDTAKCISTKEGQYEFLGSLVCYLFEGIEPESFTSNEAYVAFQAIKPAREKQRKARENRKSAPCENDFELGKQYESVLVKEEMGKETVRNKEETRKETGRNEEGNGKKRGRNAEGNGKENGRNEEQANKLVSYKASKDINCSSSNEEELSSKPLELDSEAIPYAEIVSYLNAKAGTNFKPSSKETRQHIRARWREGFRLDDFKRVIDGRCSKWLKDPKMSEYIRPPTIFGTKFESYLNDSERKEAKNDRFAKYADL